MNNMENYLLETLKDDCKIEFEYKKDIEVVKITMSKTINSVLYSESLNLTIETFSNSLKTGLKTLKNKLPKTLNPKRTMVGRIRELCENITNEIHSAKKKNNKIDEFNATNISEIVSQSPDINYFRAIDNTYYIRKEVNNLYSLFPNSNDMNKDFVRRYYECPEMMDFRNNTIEKIEELFNKYLK